MANAGQHRFSPLFSVASGNAGHNLVSKGKAGVELWAVGGCFMFYPWSVCC